MTAADASRWAIVVPVKRLPAAKSRLAAPAPLRAELALAMALDTVDAALRCPPVAAVVVVTDDDRAVDEVRRLGAHVVADEPDAGLNPALRHGAAAAAALVPGSGVAAVSSDLPALAPADLAAALAAATGHRVTVVADWSGTGTTLLTAREPASFDPSYGADSLAAHVTAGAVDLTAGAGLSLRHDVDTADDLRAVAALGCGPATSALLARHPYLVG